MPVRVTSAAHGGLSRVIGAAESDGEEVIQVLPLEDGEFAVITRPSPQSLREKHAADSLGKMETRVDLDEPIYPPQHDQGGTGGGETR